ncbi:MAG: transporter [Candidatus Omnitrophica bacterium]|nr:transporter [Candidatus Omnitrophota bacterium]
MKKGNCLRLNILLILFFTFCSFLYAGRPLTTDDAEIVEKGKFELEIGYDFIENSDKTKNQETGISLKSGLTSFMDLGVCIPFIVKENNQKINKWCNTEISTKFSIIKENEKMPGFSFTISTIPNPNQGDKRYTLNLILSKSFEKISFHLNLGKYSLKGEQDFLTYSSALEYKIGEKLNLVGEIVGEENDDRILGLLIGINYAFNDYLTFDFGFDKELNNKAYNFRIKTGFTLNW